MHVVIGGAFNGKKEWVRNHYRMIQNIQCLEEKPAVIKNKLPKENESVLILTAIEYWPKEWVGKFSLDEARTIAREWINVLVEWEKQSKKRQVVLIATDISKGIVPIEKADRDWRDLTGWFYQDLVQKAERVDEVWYGLGQQLK